MYLLSEKVNRNPGDGEKLPVCKENSCRNTYFYKHAFKMIDIKMSCKKHTNALKKIMTN